MPPRQASSQQLSLDLSVYDGGEKRIRELARRAITENGLTIDFVARLARIRHPEQLSRALAGDGTHVPGRVWAVLLDPVIDAKRIFVAGLGEMARCDVTARREVDLADENRELRRQLGEIAARVERLLEGP